MSEDIITRYQLDISDLKLKVSELESQYKKLSDAEKKAGKDGEDAAKKATQETEKQTDATTELTDKLKELGKGILAAFAVERIVAFGAESVKAFAEAEQNALKLKTAVGVNGGLSSEYDRLINQSGELQSITIFSDDDIQQLQIAALQFGLSATEVENLTPKIIDFASATGQDLNSALGLIIAGTNGAVRGLRQYGISIDEGQTKQQNYIQIVQQLTDKFNGQAEAIGNTTGGTLTKLANAWDDLKESIGGAIAPAVIGLSNLAKGFTELVTPTENESVALEKQKEQFEVLQLSITQNAIGTQERTNAIKALQAEYPSLLANVNAEKVTNEQLKDVLNQINNQYIAKIALAKQQETITPFIEAETNATSKLSQVQNDLQKELNSVLKQSEKAQTTRENQNKIDELRTIPLALAVEELIKNRTKLEGVSFTSLTKLNDLQQQYNTSQIEVSDAQIKLSDAQKDYNNQVAILKDLYGLNIDAQQQSVQSTIDYTKLSIAELKKLADKNDSFADAELTRREEINKKILEKQKEALKELEKITLEANQKALETIAKSEEDKLIVQRNAAIANAKKLFDLAGGEKNTEAVKSYNEAVLAINITYADLIKQARLKSLNEYFAEQNKLNDENSKKELDSSIQNIDANANQQILALKQSYLAKGDFSKDAEKKLQEDISKIQLDAERQRIQKILELENEKIEKKKTLAFQSAIQEAATTKGLFGLQIFQNQDFLNKIKAAGDTADAEKLAAKKQFNDALAKLGIKLTDLEISNTNVESQNWIERNEEKIKQAQATADEIINTFNAILGAQIENKQRELESLQQSYDEQDAELQMRYEKRLIGAGDFEKEQNRIKEQRIASEKKIQSEINKLKRQEDIANRARSIFDITINTAVAISKVLDKPFIAALVAIAGAAQLAAVLATPLPKYAKGTKYLQRGNNPSGIDTIPIFANEGERIIPTERNKKYWNIYEALDENKWNQFVQRNYIAPALNKQLNEYKRNESQSFAENVSRSLIFNHDLLASKIGAEIEWRNRNGIKVKGMNELIDAMSKTSDPRKR